MCFFYGVNVSKSNIEKKFNAKFENDAFEPNILFNGFSHPTMPIITDKARFTYHQWNSVA
jgi:hypothetical protein